MGMQGTMGMMAIRNNWYGGHWCGLNTEAIAGMEAMIGMECIEGMMSMMDGHDGHDECGGHGAHREGVVKWVQGT